MIAFPHSAHDLTVMLLGAGTWLAAGMLIGGFHFCTLRWNVRLLSAGGSLLPAMAVQLGRFAAIGMVLAVIAGNFGALPLISATAGILAARTLIVRRET